MSEESRDAEVSVEPEVVSEESRDAEVSVEPEVVSEEMRMQRFLLNRR